MSKKRKYVKKKAPSPPKMKIEFVYEDRTPSEVLQSFTSEANHQSRPTSFCRQAILERQSRLKGIQFKELLIDSLSVLIDQILDTVEPVLSREMTVFQLTFPRSTLWDGNFFQDWQGKPREQVQFFIEPSALANTNRFTLFQEPPEATLSFYSYQGECS